MNKSYTMNNFNIPKYARYNDFDTIRKIFKKYPFHLVDEVDNLGRTGFLYAAKNDNLDMMKYFIDLGANVEEVDHFGLNALQLAIIDDSETTASYLIELGMDTNICRSIDNNSLLHLAILNQNSYLTFKLLKYGANPKVINYRNCGIYKLAKENFDESELKELKKYIQRKN